MSALDRLLEIGSLAPKVPFVLGGEFEVTNLHAAEQVDLKRSRGSLVTQIRDAPDGGRITCKVIP